LAKLQARKLSASRTQCVWALPCSERWKTSQIFWVRQETAVVNCCYIDFDLA